MGSGCSASVNKFFGTPVPDTQVQYTGDAIESLGICTGDSLSEIESVILQKIQDFAEGNGITLNDVDTTSCALINSLAGDKSLSGLITTLISAACNLQTQVTANLATLNSVTALNLDLKCLSVTNQTISNVLQAVITKLCTDDATLASLVTTVASIQANSPTNSQVTTSISNYLQTHIKSPGYSGSYSYGVDNKTISGENYTFITAMVPPYCPIPCIADLSFFDNTGKGVTGTVFEGWYILNGQNGTPDWRGYVFGGATNVPGGTLNPSVNPSVLGSSDYATSVGDKKGAVAVRLASNNLPPHNHGGSTSGGGTHQHKTSCNTYMQVRSCSGGFSLAGGNNSPWTINDSPDYTGSHEHTISTDFGNSSGGVDSHENRQPTVYGYWIMKKG